MNSLFFLFALIGLTYGKGTSPYSQMSVPLVNTVSGSLAGKYVKVGDNYVTAFFGIPFAEPPVGDKRFKKPVPIRRWSGTLYTTEKPPPCIQYTSRGTPYFATSVPSENCLYMNIWVPEKCFNGRDRNPVKLPVLVWIYGGGFAAGAIDMDFYDGAALASYGNAIVVSMNYRVGIFGFLNTGTVDAPGNMGLLDQNLALKWIHTNVKYFGGDSGSITLFGESAGAVSVGLHMVSPMSRGLFCRAIMQSGAPYHPLLSETPETSMYKGNIIANLVGCSNDEVNFFNNPEEVLQCLKKKDPLEIAKAEDVILEKTPQIFLPSYGDEFMPLSPMAAANKNDFSNLDLLIGTNRDEGTIFLTFLMPDIFKLTERPRLTLSLARVVIQALFQNSTSPTHEAVSDFYLKDISDNQPEAILDAVANSYGDYVFVCPSLFFAEKSHNARYYLFTHRPAHWGGSDWPGVTHFADVPFVFGTPILDVQNYTAEEGRFSHSIIQKWVSFAAHGNPLYPKSYEAWPKFKPPNYITRELNPRSQVMNSLTRVETCNFWRQHFVDTSG